MRLKKRRTILIFGTSGGDVEKLAAPCFGVLCLLRLFIGASFRQLVFAPLGIFPRLKISALRILGIGGRGLARLCLLVAGACFLLCSHSRRLLHLSGRLTLYDDINQSNQAPC